MSENLNQNNTVTIDVVDNGNNNFSLDISGDKYYMGLAKEWAVKMDGKVASEDYSSKYYAQQAKNHAIDVHEAITQGIQDAIDEVTEEITELGTQYTGNITTTGDNYLEQIESAKTGAKDEISELGIKYTGEITTAGSKYLTEIASTKSGIEKEITDLGIQYTNNIENKGNSYLTQIESAKTNAQSEIEKLGTQYTEDITETGEDYLSQIKEAKNEVEQKIKDIPSKDFITQSKALETGNISSVPEVYDELQKNAHSTFDLSKFTVVGSPTITDDGIASGFDLSNYIRLGKFEINNEFTISLSFGGANWETPAQSCLFSWYKNENDMFRLFFYNKSNPQLRFDFVPEATGTLQKQVLECDLNKKHSITISYKNAILTITIDGKLVYTYDGAIKIDCLKDNFGQLGVQSLGGWYFENGTIYLNTLYISVDGVSVFSGNKTGVDIIKPDNYTVVGSPTITDDGIVSGFSTENYLTIENIGEKLKQSKNWKIEFPVIFKDGTTTTRQEILGGRSTTNPYPLFIRLWQDGIIKVFTEGITNDLGTTITLSSKAQAQANKEYFIKVFVENNVVYFYLNGELQNSHTISENISFDDIITIGKARLTIVEYVFQGSIDLNSFKIYADGKLVYQPCLRIPYTLSKTGSKIVEAKYRDRVQDMYEQYGYAPYYTIDEVNKNFTLPMGEIYGMIEKNRQNLDDILRPIGKPLMSMNEDKLLPDEIWLEGDKVLKTTYPKLTEIYGDTYAPTEAEDTDTYLYLPDCKDRTAWGSPDGSYGYIEAGLPDITGSMSNIDGGGGTITASGAFSVTGQWAAHGRGQENSNHSNVNFTASRSSKIYGGSTTVQTPSFKVRWKTRFR